MNWRVYFSGIFFQFCFAYSSRCIVFQKENIVVKIEINESFRFVYLSHNYFLYRFLHVYSIIIVKILTCIHVKKNIVDPR